MQIKKRWSIIASLVLALSVGAFGLSIAAADTPASTAQQYYPMKEGNYWIYKVLTPSNQELRQALRVMDIDNGLYRIDVFDTTLMRVAEVTYTTTSKGLVKTKQITAAGIIRFDPPQMLLSETLTVGSTWSWESGDNIKMHETSKVISTEKVTVPAGTFDAIIIQYDGTDDSGHPYTDKTWWVKGVGYVKDTYVQDGKTLQYELIEYHTGK